MYRKDASGTFHISTPWGEERIGRAVAILFDAKNGILLSHGAPESVEKALHRMAAAPLDMELVLFENACWAPEMLDQLLTTEGALPKWWQRQVARGVLDADNVARC